MPCTMYTSDRISEGRDNLRGYSLRFHILSLQALQKGSKVEVFSQDDWWEAEVHRPL